MDRFDGYFCQGWCPHCISPDSPVVLPLCTPPAWMDLFENSQSNPFIVFSFAFLLCLFGLIALSLLCASLGLLNGLCACSSVLIEICERALHLYFNWFWVFLRNSAPHQTTPPRSAKQRARFKYPAPSAALPASIREIFVVYNHLCISVIHACSTRWLLSLLRKGVAMTTASCAPDEERESFASVQWQRTRVELYSDCAPFTVWYFYSGICGWVIVLRETDLGQNYPTVWFKPKGHLALNESIFYLVSSGR